MLVKSLILSKLDYCNALYAGLPKTLIKKLQGVLRNCIRFIYNLDVKRGEDLDEYEDDSGPPPDNAPENVTIT